ncbi:ER membrane protein complex subunit 8/9-like protein [Drosera capensis]
MRYEISQNAYIKLVLHALKHKTSAVNALLVGRLVPGAHGEDGLVEVVDSVPLFHSLLQIALLPCLEIALLQIEEHYGDQGLSIVGYFNANERFDDDELSNVAKNIGDHIYRYFPQAAILLLDNKKLEALPKAKDRSPVMQDVDFHRNSYTAIIFYFLDHLGSSSAGFPAYGASCMCLHSREQLYTREASRNWKLAGSDGSSRLIAKEPTANVLLLDFILSKKWSEIVDFDDHLDDISRDWLNPGLFK